MEHDVFAHIFDNSDSESDFEGFKLEEVIINGNVLGEVVIEQSAKDRELPIDIENDWLPEHSPPTNPVAVELADN